MAITRGEFRQHLRDVIGEPREGFWKNVTLNRYIQRACNEHAKKAWSVEATAITSSLPRVMEYKIDDKAGEVIAVRYATSASQAPDLLVYDTRDKILQRNSGIRNQVGPPIEYYFFKRRIGLYPPPNKKPVFERTFERNCLNYKNIYEVGSNTLFQRRLTLQIEPEEQGAPLSDLDECRVYISGVGVYLRREALPYPGEIFMSFSLVNGYDVASFGLPAREVRPFGEWHIFDFTRIPIELNNDVQTFEFSIFGDAEYQAAFPFDYQGAGVQVGVEGDEGEEEPYLQLHPLRNDIEYDFYKNVCNDLISDDQSIEIPDQNFQTALDLAASYALTQNQRNLQWAQKLEGKSLADMEFDKSQKQQKTLGLRRQENRSGYNSGPYLYHMGGRKFSGRAW